MQIIFQDVKKLKIIHSFLNGPGYLIKQVVSLYMKKLLLIVPGALFLIVISCFIFIPSMIKVSEGVTLKTTMGGAYRTLASVSQWQKWWNYNTGIKRKDNDTSFRNGNYTFKLIESRINHISVSVENEKFKIITNLTIFQLPDDSIGILWQSQLPPSGLNPVTRVRQYYEAVNLKKSLTEKLNSLKLFLGKNENVYGFHISEAKTKDSFLISQKKLFVKPPTMEEVYNLISGLQQYAAKNNCRQTNVPMLNVLMDSNQYRVMVALPVNKEINTRPPISFIKMVDGNFITTKVQGGLGTVQNALQELNYFFSDYNRTAMAIPFQYLITNRLQQADTTKWITEIYAPVFR